MRPAYLPSTAELAEGKPHGNRIRYMAGCRCMLCRAANSRYECGRLAARKAGDWNGLVPADRARRHLLKLSRLGVGKRSVAEACDVAISTIDAVRSGRKGQIRARTQNRILSVTKDALAGGALILADRTWQIIGWLLEEGFSKAELARRFGYRSPALQLKRGRIVARNAVRVERFYNRMMLEVNP